MMVTRTPPVRQEGKARYREDLYRARYIASAYKYGGNLATSTNQQSEFETHGPAGRTPGTLTHGGCTQGNRPDPVGAAALERGEVDAANLRRDVNGQHFAALGGVGGLVQHDGPAAGLGGTLLGSLPPQKLHNGDAGVQKLLDVDLANLQMVVRKDEHGVQARGVSEAALPCTQSLDHDLTRGRERVMCALRRVQRIPCSMCALYPPLRTCAHYSKPLPGRPSGRMGPHSHTRNDLPARGRGRRRRPCPASRSPSRRPGTSGTGGCCSRRAWGEPPAAEACSCEKGRHAEDYDMRRMA